MTTNIQIEVTGGVITCSPRGGYARVQQNNRVAWNSNEPFTLSFGALDGSGGSAWPFVEPPPSGQVSGFEGTLKPIPAGTEAPAYKYTVVVAGKVLDPIIIVDKN